MNMSSHKTLASVAEHGLFGVPLTLLVETDRKRVPGTRVPLVFQTVSSLLPPSWLLALF